MFLERWFQDLEVRDLKYYGRHAIPLLGDKEQFAFSDSQAGKCDTFDL